MRKKNKPTFALDIGTRSIVGLLMEKNNEGIEIKEIVSKEHVERAMLDGQIHNIPKVSLLLKEIKKEIEQKAGLKLKKAAVAAAGRSLKTIKTTCYLDVDTQTQITNEDVLNLELQGAQKAQALLLKENKTEIKNDFYCVGYSVMKYFLDGLEIGSLIGQKGNAMGLELVAAFLPKIVIDSLQTVLIENGLELENITLEPIAAINAILPLSMRKLNLALVDIGAGTSDIAISSNGAIIGYGMVPVAGDEITESLAEKYLLDFNEAEILKRKLYLNLEKTINFTDILGIEHNEKGAEIVNNIADATQLLAEKIATEILNLNGNPPQAVILIGGGSLTPFLAEILAEKLGLSKQRVAIQKASSVKDVLGLPPEFYGPEIITPIGIGLTALNHTTLGFVPVQVNSSSINLLNLGKNTVLDALLAAGVETGQVYGRPGVGLTVEVNGKIKTFPGSLGKKATVKVNNIPAALNTLLKPHDQIEYIPASDGLPGKGWVKDLLPPKNFVTVNGEVKELPFEITINGIPQSPDAELHDGDKIIVRELNQLGELLDYWGIVQLRESCIFNIIINGKKQKITSYPFEISRAGKVLSLFDKLNAGDEIILSNKNDCQCTVSEILKKHLELDKIEEITVKVNEQIVKLSGRDLEIKINNLPAKPDALINCGDTLEVNYGKPKEPILVDIFSKIDFSLTPPPGKSNLDILLNDTHAEYTSVLKNGDNIKLTWK